MPARSVIPASLESRLAVRCTVIPIPPSFQRHAGISLGPASEGTRFQAKPGMTELACPDSVRHSSFAGISFGWPDPIEIPGRAWNDEGEPGMTELACFDSVRHSSFAGISFGWPDPIEIPGRAWNDGGEPGMTAEIGFPTLLAILEEARDG